MTNRIRHYLLIYDRANGRLLEMIEFGEHSDAALQAYAAKEREYETVSQVEVVLIGSDSLETVKVTHPNYFEDSRGSSKYLTDIA